MKTSRTASIIIGVYVITVLLWLSFVWASGYNATYEGPLYTYLLKPFLVGMTILPFIGGIIGLINSKGWGGWSSTIGRGLIGISLGILAWSGGMMIWNYYLFFTDIEVPYPSLADVIFILSWPLWSYGLMEISKVIGVKHALKRRGGKLAFVLIPLVVILLSYYLLFEVARGGQIDLSTDGLKLFFDLFYPIGDIVILSFTVLIYSLSRNFLGGTYKKAVLVLLAGFLLNYVSDFMFSYTTTKETYFNGHLVDFLFTTTMFVLSLSLTLFTSKALNRDASKRSSHYNAV